MNRTHRLLGPALLAATLLGAPAAGAQELYTYTIGALGGVGGSLDVEPGDDLGNTGFQLNLTLVTEPRTHVGFRLGRLDLDTGEGFGTFTAPEFTYVTLGGEYRFRQSYYESGLYVALGGYRLEEPDADREETEVGLALGVTGEFQINRRLGVLVELSGHWANFEEAQVFAMGHVGLAVHF